MDPRKYPVDELYCNTEEEKSNRTFKRWVIAGAIAMAIIVFGFVGAIIGTYINENISNPIFVANANKIVRIVGIIFALLVLLLAICITGFFTITIAFDLYDMLDDLIIARIILTILLSIADIGYITAFVLLIIELV